MHGLPDPNQLVQSVKHFSPVSYVIGRVITIILNFMWKMTLRISNGIWSGLVSWYRNTVDFFNLLSSLPELFADTLNTAVTAFFRIIAVGALIFILSRYKIHRARLQTI